MPRYYLDTSESETGSRIIYDSQDGMPTVAVMPKAGKWDAERQAMLDVILKTLNGP
jgi:hypothetical protein